MRSEQEIINVMPNESLTVSQAARLLGLSSERVRQLATSGRLASTRTPLGRLFDRDGVERLIAERANKTDVTT